MLCDSKVKAGMQTTHSGESLGRPQQKSVRKERIRKKNICRHLYTGKFWRMLPLFWPSWLKGGMEKVVKQGRYWKATSEIPDTDSPSHVLV